MSIGHKDVPAQRLWSERQSARGEPVSHQCEPLSHLLDGGLRRNGKRVAEAAGPPGSGQTVTTDPDGRVRLLHGPDVRPDVVELPEAPVVADVVLGPELLHDLERFVRPRTAFGERHLEILELL